jgi:hypothetical protein
LQLQLVLHHAGTRQHTGVVVVLCNPVFTVGVAGRPGIISYHILPWSPVVHLEPESADMSIITPAQLRDRLPAQSRIDWTCMTEHASPGM